MLVIRGESAHDSPRALIVYALLNLNVRNADDVITQ